MSTGTHRVAVIGGDGIGPEVIAEALKVVAAAGVQLDVTNFDLGGSRYLRDGEILSDATLDLLRAHDAILLGAVGTPDVPPGVIERGLLLKMRFELDLYINQRPFKGTAPGHTTPHDFVVVRENTEGPYVGEGGVLRKAMEEYSRLRHEEADYEFVYSPHITKGQLFKTSGHLDWYRDGMFPPMHIDAEYHEDGTIKRAGQDYFLKPMNCPMHNLIYRAGAHSYRDLPLRLFEFGTVYRYEKSGVIHGLTRVRGLTQDDAHIYCTREQMRD